MASIACKSMWKSFSRKKPLVDSSESKLAKVLTTFDLTALGIGSTLGVGVYVIAGDVSKGTAGPAVVISFLIAAIASICAGLCYAEFGARVPKAGSAYVYSYVTIGEFIAFVIGWNLILEYAIGSASVVKGLSNYLDSLFNYPMKNFFTEHLPINAAGLSEYPDFFALGVTLVFSLCLAFGAKESTFLNNIFTLVNLGVVLFVVIAGFIKVDARNWNIPESEVPEGYGSGGFLPYGVAGILKGAAVCFYGFIGFDCIATAGEEARNPRKSIPIAVCVSLGMIFLAYFSVSTVLTMMIPYYDQDENAPLPHVFRLYGWVAAEYIVGIGAMFGLCASLMGAMFPLPRIVFAMSSDGLLFKFMGDIHSKYKTPFVGTLLTGSLTGILAAIFNLSQLVNMMSIGTLLAYSMVAGCVLILRYASDCKPKLKQNPKMSSTNNILATAFNLHGLKTSNDKTSTIVKWSVFVYCIWCFCVAAILSKFEDEPQKVGLLLISLLVITSVCLILTLIILARQPTSSNQLAFTVPFVPWLPALSIFINIYLMLKLDVMTWIRFAIWIAIGLTIYFAYGIRHSKERERSKRKEGAETTGSAHVVCSNVPVIAT